MKRHRFHVRALVMSFRIERFALGCSLYKIIFIVLDDLHFSHAKQQTLGVFEKNQLLQEIEQQQVNVCRSRVRFVSVSRGSIPVQIIYHHVHRRVGCSHEQFRQIAPSRLKGDVGGAEVLKIFVGHGVKNDEIRMSNDELNPNDEFCRASVSDAIGVSQKRPTIIRHGSFLCPSSFVLRHF